MLDELTGLLIDVVGEGASIGFLPPLSKKEAQEYWESVLGPGVILWVAKLENKVCGAVQLHLSLKKNGTHRAEVAKLMVHTNQRKKGIGRGLMTILQKKAELEDISLLVLDTRLGDPSNTLYKSLEYIEAGTIPNYAKSADGELEATVFYYKEI
ncbi:GNAT family N-acetyltransferase [Bacillus subtilis]|uniref:GNAT family N-acetyltransferase n=1 Tax=Bacillus subtilis TaxID=1423 RepID=UPI000688D23F|nr:GNAT family N-acetyltransferase [Bacillus subtilis]QAW10597.1 GNAT family N-acetyltransferase [Bacillus subtilis]WBC28140.1 GNAT family N-acetyltransferase [Bacillus subtilis]